MTTTPVCLGVRLEETKVTGVSDPPEKSGPFPPWCFRLVLQRKISSMLGEDISNNV